MKLRFTLVLMSAAFLLSACSFTLAADITPPPDYVPPTLMPTLGPLYPSSAPDTQQGAAIFAEHCVPCHGAKGLGDGPMSMQLPVAVPAIGLPDVARSGTASDWFRTVTEGNLDRGMPPFVSVLSDQQRWDVVAYALTLHTNPTQLARGQSLVQSGCAGCAAKLSDQAKMAALSDNDVISLIKNGNGDVPAFGKDYSDDDALAAAAYIRSLTFAAAPQVAAATAPAATSPAVETTQGAAPATLVGSSPAAPAGTSVAAVGEVSGNIEVPGSVKPESLTVTLHGYDHSADQTSGPQEVLTISQPVLADGSYTFENVDMPVNRIFLAEVSYSGIKYRSDFAAATAASTKIELPALKLYEPSTDVSLLKLEQLHLYTDFGTAGTVQVLEIFAFTNASSNSVVISTDGSTIPFIQFPAGSTNQGFEAGQTSAPFAAADQGLAVVPSDKPYSIVAFFSLPYEKKLDISLPLAIDIPSIILLVPEGIKVGGKQLSARGTQVIQNNNYEEFSADGFKAGETLSFSVSGQPSATGAAASPPNQGLLIGAGALGLALLGVGLVLYARERRRQSGESLEVDSGSVDEVLDAILALDDLHHAGKISDDAYHARRNELKDKLKVIA